MFRKVKGLGTIISNAPPGQYFLEFADVPYYQTPPAQTNTLSPAARFRSGAPTLSLMSIQRIPDALEMQYFGSVTTNRTRSPTPMAWNERLSGVYCGHRPAQPVLRLRLSANAFRARASGSMARHSLGLQYRLVLGHESGLLDILFNLAPEHGSVGQVDVSMAAASRAPFFRLQAQTTTARFSQPPALRARLANGSVNLSWLPRQAAVTRSGQHQLVTWVPSSAWLQPALALLNYSLPPHQSNSILLPARGPTVNREGCVAALRLHQARIDRS